MKSITIFLFILTEIYLCCDDPNQISLLPPFQNTRNIQSTLGEDINIVCCHPDGADNLSWRDKANNEIVFKNSNGLFSLKDEKDRLILRIDNLSENQLGEYTCLNTKRALFISIIITERPQPLMPEIVKKDLYYPSNKPVEIRCPLTGSQVFKSWIFTRGGKNTDVSKAGDGEGYTVSEDRNIFTVQSDTGNMENIKLLWCKYQEVVNKGVIKTGLYEFTWTIYDPIDVNLVLDHEGPILESNDVRLICSFKYNEMLSVAFPNNIILKANMIINNENLTKGQVILTISKITKDFEGEYECKISRFLSTDPFKVVEESAKVRVDVVLPPKIISNDFVTSSAELNEDAYLSCQIKSKQLTKENVYFEHYQQSKGIWMKLPENYEKYDLNLTKNEINILTLLIKKVSWEDRGNYKCVAKNAAGEDNKIGQFKVVKAPELESSATLIYMATKPVRIDCSVSGYPISPSEDIVELRILSQAAPLDLNVVERRYDEFDKSLVSYEVVHKGELIEGKSYKLECYHKSMKTNIVQQKDIEIRIAQKPNIPEVSVVCSGSSGIVFKYRVMLSEDKNKKMIKNVLSYAPSEEFDAMNKKPFKVVPIKEDETNEYMIYVLKDLMASRKYTFKWETFNMFGLSNERTLTYTTADIIPPQTPKILNFSPKGNMINVNVSWVDDCPYVGSNSAIRDIVVNMKSLNLQEGKNNNWQWTERNFTLESNKNSAQFLIYLENPQIDYEIQVALRSAQGTSDSLTGTYKANVVLTGSLFSCFPRCEGNTFSSSFTIFCSILAVLFVLLLPR